MLTPDVGHAPSQMCGPAKECEGYEWWEALGLKNEMRAWAQNAAGTRPDAPVAWPLVKLANRIPAPTTVISPKPRVTPPRKSGSTREKTVNCPVWGGTGSIAQQEFMKTNWMWFDPALDDIRNLEKTEEMSWQSRKDARKLGPLYG